MKVLEWCTERPTAVLVDTHTEREKDDEKVLQET